MAQDELKTYVEQALRAGLASSALRKSLHVSGWADADIDAALPVKPVRKTSAAAAAMRHHGVAAPRPPVRRERPALAIALALAVGVIISLPIRLLERL